MNTATKSGTDAAKTASKRVVQKTAETTGDLNGNKIADKSASISKQKEKTKQKKFTFHQKKDRLLMTLYCLEHKMWHPCIKMEFQKIDDFSKKFSKKL